MMNAQNKLGQMCSLEPGRLLSIITPTYNRRQLLESVYISLLNQTNQQFEWIVIDDGSTDGTRELIEELQDRPFDIKYVWKENGGKHTALNCSHDSISGKYILLLDSDDTLLPDAVETVLHDWEIYDDDEQIGFISYLMVHKDGSVFTTLPPEDYYISDHITYRINGRVPGDQCTTIRASVFKDNPFPVFENEKFFGEGWFFCRTSSYKTVFRSKAIYVAEYQDDGLTQSIRKHQCQSPLGVIEGYKYLITPNINSYIRYKSMVLKGAFHIVAVKKGKLSIHASNRSTAENLLYPFSYLTYLLFLRKYC